MNPLHGISKLGQSVWYDNIHRGMLTSGELARMIQDDNLLGVTSNPAIFEKAITEHDDYDNAIASYLDKNTGSSSRQLFYHLAIEDIQNAADLLMPAYQASNRHDGMVSLEVSPDLANDTAATIEEAKELWAQVDRPNLMIKVPATRAGVPAIEALISEGINVNATLLFSVDRYKEVAQAHIAGLEARLRSGQAIDHIASVASFFVSRVDAAVEKALKSAEKHTNENKALLGSIAIANAKKAYQSYHEVYAQANFQDLTQAGAKPQRLLWASTGTKSKELSDILYIETLIGPNTVTTVPPATYKAYKDHGQAQATLENELKQAYIQLDLLADLGINIDNITNTLEEEGVKSFAASFKNLLTAIEQKMQHHAQKEEAVV